MKKQIDIGLIMLSTNVQLSMARNQALAEFIGKCIGRHISGDIGETWANTKFINMDSVKSLYRSKLGAQIVITTEKDRKEKKRTVVMFLEENGGF
jgi:hypothetical protein